MVKIKIAVAFVLGLLTVGIPVGLWFREFVKNWDRAWGYA